MERKEIEYYDDETLLEATFCSEVPNKKRPAILLIHAWQGKNSLICQRAEEMAQLGLHAFAIDIYGKGKLGHTSEECAALMNPFMEDRKKLKKRLLAAYNFVKDQPNVDRDNIAVMGFCFGGLCALDLARTGVPIKTAISVHGLLHKPENNASEKIKGEILALHGDLDPLVSAEELESFKQEMRDQKVSWELVVYGNAYHAFTNPSENNPTHGLVYDHIIEKKAFKRISLLLEESLK